MDNIKVTCIDDTMRPNEIAISNWVKKDHQYTPISLHKNLIQNTQYFKLLEIQTGNPLYGGYNIKRFSLPNDLEAFCKKFNVEIVIELTEDQAEALKKALEKSKEKSEKEELELV